MGGARTGDTDRGGGVDGERSEAEGMSGAMSPEAASRVGVGDVAARRGVEERRTEPVGMTAEGAAATGNGRHWRLQWRRWPEHYTKEEGGSGAKEGGRPTSPSGAG